MPGSFTHRLIQTTISAVGSIYDSAGGKSVISAHRTSCRVAKPGGNAAVLCELAIYGMPLSLMNQLSTVGTQMNRRNQNAITVEAGDSENGLFVVFAGTILEAYVDGQSQPDVCFRVSARAGVVEAVRKTDAISVDGQAKVSDLMQQAAQKIGVPLENNGVDGQLMNPYYFGSPVTMAREIARHAGIQHILDKGKLAIWNTGESRQTGSTPMISPQTGMVGYPSFRANVVIVKTLFNPQIEYGGDIQIQSDLTAATGTFNVIYIDYELESETPNGAWWCIIQAVVRGTKP